LYKVLSVNNHKSFTVKELCISFSGASSYWWFWSSNINHNDGTDCIFNSIYLHPGYICDLLFIYWFYIC